MFKDNLIMLRNINGYSQEEVAYKINISRQAYAKWENGATVPDIEKCNLLANLYNVSIDSLINDAKVKGIEETLIMPKGKNIWGSVVINDRGQIIIPKEAREKFNLVGGTRMIVLSNEEGIALITAKQFEEHIQELTKLANKTIVKEEY